MKCRHKDRPTQLNRSVGMEKREAKGMQAACFYTFWEEGGWEHYHGGGKTVESRRQVEGMKAQKSDSGVWEWVRKAVPLYITEQRSPWNINSGCYRRLTSNTHSALANGHVSVPVSLISSVQHCCLLFLSPLLQCSRRPWKCPLFPYGPLPLSLLSHCTGSEMFKCLGVWYWKLFKCPLVL